jgi:hypothetical protein
MVDVEEFRNLTLSLASSIHHGDRLLLSSRRELGPNSSPAGCRGADRRSLGGLKDARHLSFGDQAREFVQGLASERSADRE